MRILPVILSGGDGSRLWPLSRQSHPKPFVEIPSVGGTPAGNASLLAAAIADACVTVTGSGLRFLSRDAYRDAGAAHLRHHYILEPTPRGTAGAIAAASLQAAALAKMGGDDVVLAVLPADHVVDSIEATAAAIRQGAALAGSEGIALIGAPANYPDPGLGYIEMAAGRVVSFREKPDSAEAGRMIATGRHVWNSGILCFRPQAMASALRRLAPEILAAAAAALATSTLSEEGGEVAILLDAREHAAIPVASIEKAVLEKSRSLACVVAQSGWSELGSWRAVGDRMAKDAAGNAATTNAVFQDASGCVVHGGGRLVAMVGVSNLTVVDTADALLIASREAGEDVRKVYDGLAARGHEAATLHRTVHRPWGSYTVLEEGDRFKIKRIEVKPGGRLSLQSHRHRSEHWVVVAGEALVTNNEEHRHLRAGQSTYIPQGNRHRLENPGTVPLSIIEVQNGDYLGEDDIVRYEDIYGRR